MMPMDDPGFNNPVTNPINPGAVNPPMLMDPVNPPIILDPIVTNPINPLIMPTDTNSQEYLNYMNGITGTGSTGLPPMSPVDIPVLMMPTDSINSPQIISIPGDMLFGDARALSDSSSGIGTPLIPMIPNDPTGLNMADQIDSNPINPLMMTSDSNSPEYLAYMNQIAGSVSANLQTVTPVASPQPIIAPVGNPMPAESMNSPQMNPLPSDPTILTNIPNNGGSLNSVVSTSSALTTESLNPADVADSLLGPSSGNIALGGESGGGNRGPNPGSGTNGDGASSGTSTPPVAPVILNPTGPNPANPPTQGYDVSGTLNYNSDFYFTSGAIQGANWEPVWQNVVNLYANLANPNSGYQYMEHLPVPFNDMRGYYSASSNVILTIPGDPLSASIVNIVSTVANPAEVSGVVIWNPHANGGGITIIEGYDGSNPPPNPGPNPTPDPNPNPNPNPNPQPPQGPGPGAPNPIDPNGPNPPSGPTGPTSPIDPGGLPSDPIPPTGPTGPTVPTGPTSPTGPTGPFDPPTGPIPEGPTNPIPTGPIPTGPDPVTPTLAPVSPTPPGQVWQGEVNYRTYNGDTLDLGLMDHPVVDANGVVSIAKGESVSVVYGMQNGRAFAYYVNYKGEVIGSLLDSLSPMGTLAAGVSSSPDPLLNHNKIVFVESKLPGAADHDAIIYVFDKGSITPQQIRLAGFYDVDVSDMRNIINYVDVDAQGNVFVSYSKYDAHGVVSDSRNLTITGSFVMRVSAQGTVTATVQLTSPNGSNFVVERDKIRMDLLGGIPYVYSVAENILTVWKLDPVTLAANPVEITLPHAYTHAEISEDGGVVIVSAGAGPGDPSGSIALVDITTGRILGTAGNPYEGFYYDDALSHHITVDDGQEKLSYVFTNKSGFPGPNQTNDFEVTFIPQDASRPFPQVGGSMSSIFARFGLKSPTIYGAALDNETQMISFSVSDEDHNIPYLFVSIPLCEFRNAVAPSFFPGCGGDPPPTPTPTPGTHVGSASGSSPILGTSQNFNQTGIGKISSPILNLSGRTEALSADTQASVSAAAVSSPAPVNNFALNYFPAFSSASTSETPRQSDLEAKILSPAIYQNLIQTAVARTEIMKPVISAAGVTENSTQLQPFLQAQISQVLTAPEGFFGWNNDATSLTGAKLLDAQADNIAVFGTMSQSNYFMSNFQTYLSQDLIHYNGSNQNNAATGPEVNKQNSSEESVKTVTEDITSLQQSGSKTGTIQTLMKKMGISLDSDR